MKQWLASGVNIMVNSFLTHSQREYLLDSFCSKLDSIDSTFPMEELIENMMAMNNSEFYNECREFIPEELLKLSTKV